MSASVNMAILLGRITKDPELRKTSTGVSYCRFTIACDRPKKKDSQEDPSADFINCVAWRQSAEFLCEYGRKGNLISATGSIQTGSYTDREGRKIYTTDIMADRVQIVESGAKPKSDYPNNGRSVRLDEVDTSTAFDTGPEGSEPISSDDLPF